MYAVALLFSYKHRSSWVKISGTVYKPKNVVALGSYVSGPLFGEIVSILTTDVSECYFVCELFKTISFNTHLHAYEVETQGFPIPIVVCRQQDFADPHVLAVYHISNLKLITLKYHLYEKD